MKAKMMFDWLTISFEIPNYDEWKSEFNYDLWATVNLRTGEQRANEYQKGDSTIRIITNNGKVSNYLFQVKEVKICSLNSECVRYFLTIKGSPHKNHSHGHNYSRFPLSSLCKEIEFIKSAFNVDIQRCKLNSLEFGVNIKTDFVPLQFLENSLLLHRTKPFERYNSRISGGCIGFYCKKSQQIIKYYDKGLQMELDNYLLRAEISFLNMQPLHRRGIHFLSDLPSRQTLSICSQSLLNAWKDTLLFDSTIKINNPILSGSEKKLLLSSEYPKAWQKLSKENSRQFRYNKTRLRKINEKVGQNKHKLIKCLIEKECDYLMNN